MTYKLATYLLIAILFASQSFAVNGMNCFTMHDKESVLPMVKMSDGTTYRDAANDPCMMQMSNDEPPMTQGVGMNMDCCEQNSAESCHCPIAACGVFTLMSAQSDFANNLPEDKISDRLFSIPSLFPAKLQRPPING
ncbi:hypothetical protein [Paraglaciecola polaris]|uniref:Uncharacterized protein n=1 Tax=Paraglaciecola polaris LMG 21857 TaxID=1129793 RepID=K6Z935_9ALTE|nr:hypothetical protein [Paraglaciecola polaris]GAC32676.1 hypothetical protein GPLA_1766 [Paraglaciecola polaris LMG 21857]|tara:strand:+ start:19612 stop:20022 length:411 start_codon:yes stop_codon:yes gene_type:complete